jgi:hypothetical protein
LTSTLLTLLLVPCLYTLLEDGARMMMRAWKPASLALLAFLALGAKPADASETLRSLDATWQVRGARQVEVRFPVGELTLVGTDGDAIVAHLNVEGSDDPNKHAYDNADRVKLVLDRSGDHLKLHIDGWRMGMWNGHNVVEGRIEIPRALALEVDMRIGELEVRGFEGPQSVKLGIGEANLSCDPAIVGRLDVDLTIGEGNVIENGRAREWANVFGGGYRWDGVKGGPAVRLSLGMGEANVSLEREPEREALR